MNRLALAILILVATIPLALATTRVSLQDGTGLELGTATNPMDVAITGVTITDLGDGPLGIGSTNPQGALDVDGYVYITGDLNVGGKYIGDIDTGVYSRASSPYPVNLLGLGADGTIYGGPGVVYDKALYSATPSTGKAAKILWIDVDGLIYGI